MEYEEAIYHVMNRGGGFHFAKSRSPDCRRALSEQFRDKGVVFIGQNVWDDDSAVKPFVKKMADKMTYRVVLDDKSKEPDGFMSNHWWKRKVNHHSIPNAFVIKQGRVFWIGDPTHLTAQLLNEILTDHYDLTKAAAEYKKQQKENQS